MKKLFVWEDLEDWAYILKNYEHIEDYYTQIRLFHACKPTDIASYYLKGIQSLDVEYIRDIAHDVFNSNKFPEIKVEDIDDAIQQIQSITPEGIAYFALDKRDLLEYCGHYLIYGSEFVLGVANELRRKYGKDYSQVLKELGIPTVWSCDIPIDAISKSCIDELNQRAKYNMRVNTELKYSNAPFIDFSILIGGVIHPSCITSHYHPKRIKDPIDNNKTYISDSNECSRCSKERANEKI